MGNDASQTETHKGASGSGGTGKATADSGQSVRVTSSALKQAVAPKQRDSGPYVPPALAAGAGIGWRFLVVVAVVLVLGKVLVTFKTLVIPVAIALLLTVLLQPMHRFFTKTLRVPKVLSALASLLVLLGLVAGLVTVAGKEVVSGISDVSDQAVAGVMELTHWAQGAPLHLDLSSWDKYWNGILDNLQGYTGTLISGALSVTSTLGHLVTGLLIIVFCTIFFLVDGRRIWSWIIGLLPRHVRERSHQAGRRGLVTLASYVRTQILVAFIDALGIGLGAFAIGLPLAIPMGVLVFLGSFIPFIGAIVTGIIAILVALVVKGWVMALVMMGIVLLVQQLESHVLQPFLMGRAVSLHPVAVLLVVLAGSLLAGIVGALFAVPLVAVINTVVLYFHGHDKFPQLGFEDHIEMRPEGRRAVMVTSAARYVAGGAWDDRPEEPEPVAIATLDRLWSKLPRVGRVEGADEFGSDGTETGTGSEDPTGDKETTKKPAPWKLSPKWPGSRVLGPKKSDGKQTEEQTTKGD